MTPKDGWRYRDIYTHSVYCWALRCNFNKQSIHTVYTQSKSRAGCTHEEILSISHSAGKEVYWWVKRAVEKILWK